MVDYTTKSSTFSSVSSPSFIKSREPNTVNTVNTGNSVNSDEIKIIKKELLRWYSILTPEYNRWKAGEYIRSLLSTTEWVQTEKDKEVYEK